MYNGLLRIPEPRPLLPCFSPSTAATERENQPRSTSFANGSASRDIRCLPVAIRAARPWARRFVICCFTGTIWPSTGEAKCCSTWRPGQTGHRTDSAGAAKRAKIVVADRYLLANVVYQGYGGGLDVQTLWEVGRVATGGLLPELTIVLDLPAEVAAARINRDPDRMEMQGLEFHARVREGFLTEARRQPGRIVVVDASRPIDVVQADLRIAAQRVLHRIAYEEVDTVAEEGQVEFDA